MCTVQEDQTEDSKQGRLAEQTRTTGSIAKVEHGIGEENIHLLSESTLVIAR